jgi:hypothetical protein
MTKIYTVEIHHQGEIHTIEVPEDKQILRAACAAGIELPASCNSGVCTRIYPTMYSLPSIESKNCHRKRRRSVRDSIRSTSTLDLTCSDLIP